MNHFREYTFPIVLVAFQVVAVVWGTLAVSAVRNSAEEFGIPMVPGSVASFVQGWGFVFLMVPVIWIGTTLLMERCIPWFSRTGTVVSGFLLLVCLGWFFTDTAIRLVVTRDLTI